MFTLRDVCERWMLSEDDVLELILSGKVYCQADPFRADSFRFLVDEEEKMGSEDPEFTAAFRLACDIDAKAKKWRDHGHPSLKMSQADIHDAETRIPELARAAKSRMVKK